MPPQVPEFLYDENVLPAVIRLIEEAKRQVVLVSPYNDFSTTLSGVVLGACKRPETRVVVIGRTDQSDKERSHFNTLAAAGAEVHLVERLHSKIYLNESMAIVGSMNLAQGSAVNSREIAFRFTDEDSRAELVSYIRNRLISGATRWQAPSTREQNEQSWYEWIAKSAQKRVGEGRLTAQATGKCIRCRTRIAQDTEHPLCDSCFKVWKKYSDPLYVENYCHKCGLKADTSYAKPLCYPCYAAGIRTMGRR